MNKSRAENDKLSLKNSVAWMEKFKSRWFLRHFRSYGESGGANVDVVATKLPKLQENIRKYEKRNIFDTDECVLQYKLATDTTIAAKPLAGRKK